MLVSGGQANFDLDTSKGELLSKIVPVCPEEDAARINELFVRTNNRPDGCQALEKALLGSGIAQPIPTMNYKIQNAWGETCGYTCTFYCCLDWADLAKPFYSAFTTSFVADPSLEPELRTLCASGWDVFVKAVPGEIVCNHEGEMSFPQFSPYIDEFSRSLDLHHSGFGYGISSREDSVLWSAVEERRAVLIFLPVWRWVKNMSTFIHDRDQKRATNSCVEEAYARANAESGNQIAVQYSGYKTDFERPLVESKTQADTCPSPTKSRALAPGEDSYQPRVGVAMARMHRRTQFP